MPPLEQRRFSLLCDRWLFQCLAGLYLTAMHGSHLQQMFFVRCARIHCCPPIHFSGSSLIINNETATTAAAEEAAAEAAEAENTVTEPASASNSGYAALRDGNTVGGPASATNRW